MHASKSINTFSSSHDLDTFFFSIFHAAILLPTKLCVAPNMTHVLYITIYFYCFGVVCALDIYIRESCPFRMFSMYTCEIHILCLGIYLLYFIIYICTIRCRYLHAHGSMKCKQKQRCIRPKRRACSDGVEEKVGKEKSTAPFRVSNNIIQGCKHSRRRPAVIFSTCRPY